MHDAMHKLPGMPAHERAGSLNANALAGRLHHRSGARPVERHQRPPRVLAGWQAWIGRLFGQDVR
jgi:hypothetical protein